MPKSSTSSSTLSSSMSPVSSATPRREDSWLPKSSPESWPMPGPTEPSGCGARAARGVGDYEHGAPDAPRRAEPCQRLSRLHPRRAGVRCGGGGPAGAGPGVEPPRRGHVGSPRRRGEGSPSHEPRLWASRRAAQAAHPLRAPAGGQPRGALPRLRESAWPIGAVPHSRQSSVRGDTRGDSPHGGARARSPSLMSISPGPGRGAKVTRGDPALSVLLVEDNDDAREALRILLELKGQRVMTARDGREAVQEVRAQSPDVALIDIGLPDMD